MALPSYGIDFHHAANHARVALFREARSDVAEPEVNVQVRGAPAQGRTVLLEPEGSLSEGLELELWHVEPDGLVAHAAEGRESLLVVLGGVCSLHSC